jgi:hypothetical protein
MSPVVELSSISRPPSYRSVASMSLLQMFAVLVENEYSISNPGCL